MTVGKDVSMLFMAVLKNMETQNMELKKLVYLYVMNYAKTHPDKAILGINTFRKVAIDSLLHLGLKLCHRIQERRQIHC